ncbi:putative integral membrane protein [Theileria parva strain Muguga]|uniref:Uncharacterized protein n=1 Tax=Theileria parva TaxID=5875 RepID=Q4N337_THEPA|nr:putative integral membrane protein [Theileria parva strain Muguga]EAN31502.1 putative integral membrane protein [Theileria parva strain Muguga]|eukprot:XP_763785.1 hypothetical protein [Theileria parva strain Muguga]
MMKTVLLCVVYTFVSVSAAPLLLNKDLLTKRNPGVATLTHASYRETTRTGMADEGYVRYLYMVPTTAQKSYLEDGVASGPLLHTPVVHRNLTPDYSRGEVMTEMVGVSDCRKWHAVLVGLWNGAVQTYLYFTGVKTDDGKWKWTPYTNLQELVDFVHGMLPGEKFKALVRKGVGAHEFFLKLFTSYA